MNATTTQISNELADRMQRHLTEEEQSLVCVLDAVRAVHDSLRNLDGNALAEALDNEAAALRQAQGVQSRRQQIRAEAAGVLGVPPQDVTLTVFAEKATGLLQTTVVESQQKLAQMSTEMERLNRQNSAMLQQSLSLIRGIVGRLTGTAGGETYNAGGAREETRVGSLVQWGG